MEKVIDRRSCKDVKCGHNLNGRCCLYNQMGCATYRNKIAKLTQKKTK